MDIIPCAPAAMALAILGDAGWQAWLVGGWVRDSLMGRDPHDADIATNAPWQQTAKAFRSAGFAVHETGTQHGTVTVIAGGEPIEITTYRVEGPYSDARHPDYVEFVDDIELDLSRRDFTMNAIAFRPNRGLVDPFGGRADIAARLVRAVGDADARFQEDPLRILRAARFASQLGFHIEPHTLRAATRHSALLEGVAAPRVGAEFTKLLLGSDAQRVIEEELDIVSAVIPELAGLRGFVLKSHRHSYDLLGHLAHTVAAAPARDDLRWAALLHDIAKPHANHDHAARSAQQARGIMRRLGLGRIIVDGACDAIAWHETCLPPDPRAVQLFAAHLGGDEQRVRRVLLLQQSDAVGHGPGGAPRAEEVSQELDMLEHLASDNAPMRVGDLAVDGNDVVSVCEARGAKIGQTLQALLADVIEGLVINEKEALIAHIPQAYSHACENIFQKKLEKFLTRGK